jgi:hypothetical protein
MFFEQFKMFEKINRLNYEWHCQKIENKWIYIFKSLENKFMDQSNM